MLLSARVLTVEQFFRLGTFTAASVQRDYVWDAKQSEELLADIERACAAHLPELEHHGGPVISIAGETGEEAEAIDGAGVLPAGQEDTAGYHLGAMVLRRIGPGTAEIFDGLQRATTLTILLCVIRDLTASEELRGRISGLIQDGGTCRLYIDGAGHTLSSEILAPGQTLKTFKRPAGARGTRIRNSRSIFHGYLSAWDQERLSRFAGFLLSHTLLVVSETESHTLARQVFITANNRGVQLSAADIFKGQLLDLAGDGEPAEMVALRWHDIVKLTGDRIEDFMRAYDFIKRCEPQGADHLAKLAASIERNFGPKRIAEVLDDILRHASTWVSLQEKMNTPPASEAELDVWRLRFFKWPEWQPVALAWYHAYSAKRGVKPGSTGTKAERTLHLRFAALHRICMMMMLAKFSANDRARIFSRALSQSRNPFSTSAVRPGALTFRASQIERIYETLATPLYDDEMRLTLIRWIESVSGGAGADEDIPRATVEHILPKRPAKDSQWLADFPDEEERFSACHSIGNLALMDHAENVRLMNSDFHLKLPVIREQSKKYRTLASVAEKTAWTHADIRERASQMIDFTCQVLNIPRTPAA